MKITYLKLENFVSIMAGTGKDKIELNLSKGKNNKILLIGDNGSGKSSILSCLNPYRGTNDNRDMTVLEGKKGYKEIHYTIKDKSIIIKHHYGTNSSQNKSYIEKDGKELNENGGIKLFNQIVETELLITPDYFTVGRIGSNVSNFIDYSTVDRKKYINKFIPSIDEYLDAYKIVSDKVLYLNRQLKSINIELEKYDNLEQLVEIKKKIEEMIDNNLHTKSMLEISKSDGMNKMDLLKDEISMILKENDIKVNDVFNALEILDKQLGDCNIEKEYEANSLEKFLLSSPKLNNYTLDELKEKSLEFREKQIETNGKIALLEEKIKNLRDKKSSIEEKISSTTRRIESFDNSDSAEILEEQHSELNATMVSIDQNIRQLLLDNDLNNTNSVYVYDTDGLDEILNVTSTIVQSLDSIAEERTDTIIDIILTYRDQVAEDDIIMNSNVVHSMVGKDYTEMCQTIKTLELEHDKLSKERESIIKSSGFLKILEASEHSDHTDDCPFVPMAIGFKDSYDSLGEMENYIESIEDQRISLEKKSVTYKDTIRYLEKFNRIFKYVVSKRDVMDIVGVTFNEFEGTLTNSYLSLTDRLINLPRALKSINNLISQRKQIESKATDIAARIKDRHNQISLVEDLELDINQCKNELEIVVTDASDVVASYENEMRLAKKYSATSQSLMRVVTHMEKLSLLDAQIEVLRKCTLQLKDNTNEINKLKDASGSIDSKIEITKQSNVTLQKELEEINYDYFAVKENVKKLNLINSVLDDFNTVKDSLDPKKGIPLVFINNYLVDIAERTNDLLSIAYKDNFSIAFEVNDKEFKIEVNKSDGTTLNDISLASQGETDMTNTSLSLAMMHNITKGYNVLYLDEVDATLDDKNRRLFLDVIDRQIEVLGTEQAFIISHNNEFYSADIDLILLDGFDTKIDIEDDLLMTNKSILFNINKTI